MWEAVAVIAPIVVSINALIFKRLDDLDGKLSAMPANYVTRDELVARFNNIDDKLVGINDRIEMTKKILTLETQQRHDKSRWYARSPDPRRNPYDVRDGLDGGEIEER